MNTNQNLGEVIRELLAKLPQYNLGDDPITEEPFTVEEHMSFYPELQKAEKAILKAAKAEMLDIVGEDSACSCGQNKIYHDINCASLSNDLRQDLRQRIKERLGK